MREIEIGTPTSADRAVAQVEKLAAGIREHVSSEVQRRVDAAIGSAVEKAVAKALADERARTAYVAPEPEPASLSARIVKAISAPVTAAPTQPAIARGTWEPWARLDNVDAEDWQRHSDLVVHGEVKLTAAAQRAEASNAILAEADRLQRADPALKRVDAITKACANLPATYEASR
jgi:hypothetical protein